MLPKPRFLLLAPILFSFLFPNSLRAAATIDLSPPIPAPLSGHLKMGGSNPQGVRIDANSRYLTLDGKPWLPVMGEFHYSRYPHQEWERELLKIKAGGITVVSCYIFWIHHEEVEGTFDWSGDKDLRQFVQLCAKHGLYVVLRLGPWDHGEARNGGLPDWLLAKIPQRQLRTTDPAFMAETRILYQQIFSQVTGLLYKDGGPIIGVQVENELRNSAPYLLALKNLARDLGFDVPLYTMTGWGPARVPQDELLPMFGGYSDGFWIDGNTIAGASRIQFFFTHNPNDERTRLTARPGEAPAYMAYLSRYPYLTCEIGGGMAISYARRPLLSWKDIASAALCKLGDGSNLMGYYMYHGGGNPPGKLSTLQETQATNYPNDMPVINYDFQAPLGQFGQERQSYHALRRLHMFLHDFGPELCLMPSTLPSELPHDLNDTQTLRWSVRSDGHRGFIFINNYTRGLPMSPKPAQFILHLAGGDQTVPASPANLPADSFMIWPFNLPVGDVTLAYATAQLLCRVPDGPAPCYCFFAPEDMDAEFAFNAKTTASIDLPPDAAEHDDGNLKRITNLHPGADCLLTLHAASGAISKILLLTDEQALHAWKSGPRLFWSPQNLFFDDTGATILTTAGDTPELSIFPPPAQNLNFDGKPSAPASDGIFARYSGSHTGHLVNVQYRQLSPAGPPRVLHNGSRGKPEMPSDDDFNAAAVWQITIPPDALTGNPEVCLNIDYLGDAARAYIGDRLIDDDFYYGRPWTIGLRRFAPDVLQKGITLKILPLAADSPVVMQPDLRPSPDPKAAPHAGALQLRGISAESETETFVGLSN